MSTGMKHKKWLSILLVLAMTIGLVYVPALAATETIGNETGNTLVSSTYYFGQSFTPVNDISVSSVEFYMR